ncbi:MAG: hypothetical protein KatS3mg085_145 [Candidatus Dojkabacteria bacterium]|nr:MAG: hypothetical protein KatS3mg085_145 [Candidatus Dojkabacteria bacterium]
MRKNYLNIITRLNLEVFANIYLVFSALLFILSLGYYVNEGNLATSDSSASAGPALVGPGGTCVPNETVIDICEGTAICCQCGRHITGEEIGNKCLPQGIGSCTTYCESLFNEYADSKGYNTLACGTVACSKSVGCCDSPRSMCGNDPSCLSSTQDERSSISEQSMNEDEVIILENTNLSLNEVLIKGATELNNLKTYAVVFRNDSNFELRVIANQTFKREMRGSVTVPIVYSGNIDLLNSDGFLSQIINSIKYDIRGSYNASIVSVNYHFLWENQNFIKSLIENHCNINDSESEIALNLRVYYEIEIVELAYVGKIINIGIENENEVCKSTFKFGTSNLNSPNNITASVLGVSSDLSEIDEVLFIVSTYNDLLKNEESELSFDPNQAIEEVREYVLSGDTNNLPTPAKNYADKFIKSNICYGDLDSDGSVNLKDLARYAKIYGGVLEDSGKLLSLSRFAQNYNKESESCSYLFDLEVINE